MNIKIIANHLMQFVGFISLMLSLSTAANAADISGVRIEDKVIVADRELMLNGAGVFKKSMFQVYVAGLYLSQRESSIGNIEGMQGPKRLHLVMLRDVDSRTLMGKLKSDDRRVLEFMKIFASVPYLQKGDSITIDYVPNVGATIKLNDKKIYDAYSGWSVFRSLLDMWVGENPVDDKLKSLLLGNQN